MRLSGDDATLFDRRDGRYYRTSISNLPPEALARSVPVRPVFSRVTAGALTLATFGCLLANLFVLSEPRAAAEPEAAMVPALYLLVSIVLHEAAHIGALRLCGRRIDRIGFKMNYWVFPAVYVRMNQSLLLGRSEQAVIHLAGVTSNLAVNATLGLLNLLVIHSDSLAIGVHVVFVAVIWNLAPILGSDGYRTLLAATGIPAARRLRENPPWLIALRLGGWIAALAFSIRLFHFVWSLFLV
jgi:putative peptide zinc metalloprotease protein